MTGYFCDECGGKPKRTESWYVGRTWIDEHGNKGAQRFCSQECVVVFLLRREAERTECEVRGL